ncbi:MAG: 2-C-methyl-D-erythritol 4-phosphate cytidylyltransferase [Lachnospiraceae bacterium]|nr:2-C-methyl-D-erythritol 4-phosphate cytidylyltransferase [Lachnospiraceae bacterium]
MDEKIIAVVLSGGKGKRMGTSVSKQYLLLNDKPILYYSLKAFDKSSVDEIVLVVGSEDKRYVSEEIVKKYNIRKVSHIVDGGKERYNSVYNALECIEKNCSKELKINKYVLIHDGARPFITPEIINRTIEEVKRSNACIVGMKVKDTIKLSDEENCVSATPDRNYVWQVQTPQAFEFNLIKKCYDRVIKENNTTITDDSMVVELSSDIKIKLIEGSYTNIKITTPEDINIGKSILNGELTEE